MKKTILTLVAISAAASVMGQGVVNFSTRITGTVVGHVYGAVAGELPKTGNTAAETPGGTQTYQGAFLQGSGFSAELFFAVGTLGTVSESALQRLTGTITTFRTGASFGGTPAPVVLPVPGVVPGSGIGTFQVRAWDNLGGTITSYDAALNVSARGKSELFEVTGLGDGVLTLPGNMVNFRSFNITIVPEPSTFVLAGLGAAALVIFRRRK